MRLSAQNGRDVEATEFWPRAVWVIGRLRRTLAVMLHAAARRCERPVLAYETDASYWRMYREGLDRVDDPQNATASRQRYQPPRFYNLVQLSRTTRDLPGETIEIGCYRGLSSFLLCQDLRADDATFTGQGYHIVDSFEGLSTPTPGKDTWTYREGLLATDLEAVQRALSTFPGITFHKGWVPGVLSTLPDTRYRFVHVDVDLYEPALACLEYFYPRMVSGGLMVVDDYGFLQWGGIAKACDRFRQTHGVPVAALTTGNAVIVKHEP